MVGGGVLYAVQERAGAACGGGAGGGEIGEFREIEKFPRVKGGTAIHAHSQK